MPWSDGDRPIELRVAKEGVVSLPPEVSERAGLRPGDILSLQALSEGCVSLENYREVLRCWDVVDRQSFWRFIAEFLSRPLTAVEPGSLAIPAELLPLAAGEKVGLTILGPRYWQVLWLYKIPSTSAW